MNQPKSSNSGQLPILKIPLAFYGLPSDPRVPKRPEDIARLDRYVDRLTNDLKEEIIKAKANNTTNIPKDIHHAVRTMPAALFRLPDDYAVPLGLFPILHEHIYYVYSAFKANPTPDPNLETMLTGYPEYIYYLLMSEISSSITLSQSQECSVRSLFNNPFWAIKWLESHFSEDLYKALLRNLYNLKDNDAYSAHCYHWLKTRTGTEETKKEEIAKILSVLGNQPCIAIITALEYPNLDVEQLLAEVQTYPMWSYNWLRLVGSKRGKLHKLMENLTTWTPWGIQYVEDVKPEDASEVLEQIKQKAKNPWWDEWLDLYLQRREENRT